MLSKRLEDNKFPTKLGEWSFSEGGGSRCVCEHLGDPKGTRHVVIALTGEDVLITVQSNSRTMAAVRVPWEAVCIAIQHGNYPSRANRGDDHEH